MPQGNEKHENIYSPVLIIKDGKYYFHIRELNLVSKGDSLESAYQNLLEDQEAQLQSFKEIDGADQLPPPMETAPGQTEKLTGGNTTTRLITDFIKYGIIALIFAFALQFAAQGIFSHIRNSINMEIAAAKNKIKDHLTNPQKVTRNNNTLITGIENYKPAITKFLNLSCTNEVNPVERQPGNEKSK